MVKPTVRYRTFRSDDPSHPIFGPITLELASIASNSEGSAFEARAPRTSINRTGLNYDMITFPMLRGFV